MNTKIMFISKCWGYKTKPKDKMNNEARGGVATESRRERAPEDIQGGERGDKDENICV